MTPFLYFNVEPRSAGPFPLFPKYFAGKTAKAAEMEPGGLDVLNCKRFAQIKLRRPDDPNRIPLWKEAPVETNFASWLERMNQDGFLVAPGVFSPFQVDEILTCLHHAFQLQPEKTAIRSDAGSVYAARNILALWPAAATAWRRAPLPGFLQALLGPQFGLVRTLFFDKPPDRTWALPWHKDVTIAVQDNRRPSTFFGKPTVKAGVPHDEAPRGAGKHGDRSNSPG